MKLDRRTRSRIFWLTVAAGVAGSMALFFATTDPPRARTARHGRSTPYQRTPMRRPPRPAIRTERDVSGEPDWLPPPARDVARRFVAAFLNYEIRARLDAAERTLAATTSRGFGRTLTSREPRAVAGARPLGRGRLTQLAAGRTRNSRGWAVASVRRGRVTTTMLLLLERKDARWMVVRIAG